MSRKNVKNEHQQVGQFVVRLDRSIYRSLDNLHFCGGSELLPPLADHGIARAVRWRDAWMIEAGECVAGSENGGNI